jgi:hypothetical protein
MSTQETLNQLSGQLGTLVSETQGLNTEYSDKISAIRGFTSPTAGTFKLNDGTIVPNYVKAMNDFEDGYDGRLTTLENARSYINNGIKVHTTPDGWHQYTVGFYDSANYPDCTNDMQFFEVAKFHRSGSEMVEIEIQSQHRGMNNIGYHEKTTLQTSGSSDGVYFQGTKIGQSSYHGVLLNSSDITNDRANYTRFVFPNGHPSYVNDGTTTPALAPPPFEFTLKGIGDPSWSSSKLVLAIPASCGSNKSHTVVVRWKGSSNDITPMQVHTNTYTNSAAVNIAEAPAIHNS